MPSSQTLKVGLIGTGGIQATHMPGWQASPHAEVIAGSDINPEALAAWGQKHGVSQLVSDPRALFDDPQIDIIDICVPNSFHESLAIAALDAGKHVICEKPLAPTPKAVENMIAARDRSGKLLMTAQHHRYSGTSRALKQEIDQGALGEIYHARSWMMRRGFSPYTRSFVDKRMSGGGACIDIGVHILDLTLWMMGNPEPLTVSGAARTELAKKPQAFSVWNNARIDPDIYDVEEMASAFVRFENGATLILEVSWLLHHDVSETAWGEDTQMWLYGKDGGSHWPKCEIYQSDNATMQFSNRKLLRTDSAIKPHAFECMDFAKAVVEGRPSPVPPEQSLQVMRILDGIYRSQEAGREVTV
jgi:predicted dehydrogenase